LISLEILHYHYLNRLFTTILYEFFCYKFLIKKNICIYVETKTYAYCLHLCCYHHLSSLSRYQYTGKSINLFVTFIRRSDLVDRNSSILQNGT